MTIVEILAAHGHDARFRCDRFLKHQYTQWNVADSRWERVVGGCRSPFVFTPQHLADTTWHIYIPPHKDMQLGEAILAAGGQYKIRRADGSRDWRSPTGAFDEKDV